jgi:signal transduction histidine kinase
MLFTFFFVVVWLLTAFRDSHDFLEQTVERRTAALRAEMEERRRLERAKTQAERLAVVGSLAAKVAHEIRNPLGSISLNLDLIGEELNALANSEARSPEQCLVLLREMLSQILRISQQPFCAVFHNKEGRHRPRARAYPADHQRTCRQDRLHHRT